MVKNNASHILVIRLSAMGDVAITVPVLLALTQQYPHLRITLLTRGFFSPMFDKIKNVSVFEARVKDRHKGVWGLWKLYKELKKEEPDAIADLHNVMRSNILKRFFTMDQIPFSQIDKGRRTKKALTSSKNKVFQPLTPTYERYASVFEDLGYPLNLTNGLFLQREELAPNVLSVIGTDSQKWVGIAPFAAFPGKMYPLTLMEELIEKLASTKDVKILLFGGGSEEKKQLEHWASIYNHSICIAGKLSFKEELALISNLDLMVSMDSGNGHLAAMYGIPTITLWGVTHPYAGFGPYKQKEGHAFLANRDKFPLIPTSVYGNKMPAGYEKVMETIDPAVVHQKIKEVLSH